MGRISLTVNEEGAAIKAAAAAVCQAAIRGFLVVARQSMDDIGHLFHL